MCCWKSRWSQCGTLLLLLELLKSRYLCVDGGVKDILRLYCSYGIEPQLGICGNFSMPTSANSGSLENVYLLVWTYAALPPKCNSFSVSHDLSQSRWHGEVSRVSVVGGTNDLLGFVGTIISVILFGACSYYELPVTVLKLLCLGKTAWRKRRNRALLAVLWHCKYLVD